MDCCSVSRHSNGSTIRKTMPLIEKVDTNGSITPTVLKTGLVGQNMDTFTYLHVAPYGPGVCNRAQSESFRSCVTPPRHKPIHDTCWPLA